MQLSSVAHILCFTAWNQEVYHQSVFNRVIHTTGAWMAIHGPEKISTTAKLLWQYFWNIKKELQLKPQWSIPECLLQTHYSQDFPVFHILSGKPV